MRTEASTTEFAPVDAARRSAARREQPGTDDFSSGQTLPERILLDEQDSRDKQTEKRRVAARREKTAISRKRKPLFQKSGSCMLVLITTSTKGVAARRSRTLKSTLTDGLFHYFSSCEQQIDGKHESIETKYFLKHNYAIEMVASFR